jgi:DNA polymerase elongation subunit (family B)
MKKSSESHEDPSLCRFSRSIKITRAEEEKPMPNNTKKPKILFWDVETSYLMARIWAPGRKISVSHKQLVEGYDQPRIICIAYKWLGEKQTHFLDWGAQEQDPKPMLTEFSRVISSADLSIGHNVDKFDLRQLNTALLLADLPPLPPHTTEDTLKQMRKYFSMPSNTLDYVSHQLTNSPKTKLDWQDWVAVVEGKDSKALNRMIKYCMQDVRALEKVYQRIAPYCEPKMHAGIAQFDDREACPRCGAPASQQIKNGVKVLKSGKYQRFHCQACGSKYRDSRRVK